MSRPKTSQPSRTQSQSRPDEGLKIFRVRPKLLSREAFKNKKTGEDDLSFTLP